MNLKTTELQIGQIVETHGVQFKLVAVNNRKEDKYGTTINFKTEVVADNSGGHFPKSWQHDFTIQGNQNATWKVISNAEAN